MGKHNGKSRNSGLKVGAALANRAKKVIMAIAHLLLLFRRLCHTRLTLWGK